MNLATFEQIPNTTDDPRLRKLLATCLDESRSENPIMADVALMECVIHLADKIKTLEARLNNHKNSYHVC